MLCTRWESCHFRCDRTRCLWHVFRHFACRPQALRWHAHISRKAMVGPISLDTFFSQQWVRFSQLWREVMMHVTWQSWRTQPAQNILGISDIVWHDDIVWHRLTRGYRFTSSDTRISFHIVWHEDIVWHRLTRGYRFTSSDRYQEKINAFNLILNQAALALSLVHF